MYVEKRVSTECVCFEEDIIRIQNENLPDHIIRYEIYIFGFNLLDDEIFNHNNNQGNEYSKITFKYANIVD